MDLVVMASAFHLISSEPCMPPELCLCVCVLFCLVDCVSHVCVSALPIGYMPVRF